MANDESGTDLVPPADARRPRDPGTAVERADAVQNPGLPPHRLRVTDTDPKAAKRAERVIVLLFYVSVIGSVFAMTAYFAFPIKPDDLGSVRLNNVFIGIGLASRCSRSASPPSTGPRSSWTTTRASTSGTASRVPLPCRPGQSRSSGRPTASPGSTGGC